MLPKPKTNTQEILLTLIEKRKVSIMDYPYLSGFRTRISELSKILKFKNENVTKLNKHGNKFTYVVHKLELNEIGKCIKLYKQLQNG